MIKAQDKHVRQGARDTAHEPALRDMRGRWRHPKTSLDWYRRTKHDFAALPEDLERPA
jgi:hypothetical protein